MARLGLLLDCLARVDNKSGAARPWVADGGWIELEDLFSPSVELWLLRHEWLVVCRDLVRSC